MRPTRKRHAPSAPSHRHHGKKKGGSSKKAPLIIGGCVALLAIIGIIIWLVWPKSGWFDGSDMEEFVAAEIPMEKELPEKGVDAYIDFSNGMQHAYKDEVIKSNLMGIVNKLTKEGEFFSLANEEITPMGRQDSKEIYNRIIADASYDNTSAPIEQTLARIVKEQRPAFLMTDFEEYTGGKIQLENYAKKYFIDWLKGGNNITFYVMDFMENGKPKHLYFTVFDDYSRRLVKDVEDALKGKQENFRRFTLSNNLFAMSRAYDKNLKGGNYHGPKGIDDVSMVDEGGTSESYRIIDGWFAEFYPSVAESWVQIVENARSLSDENIDSSIRFRHLISDRFINLTLNSGYDIEELDLVVYDVTGPYRKKFDDSYQGNGEPVRVHDMLRLGKTEVDNPEEFEIQIDLDPRFDGTFPDADSQTALYRADVVVKKATPRYALIQELFEWPGNNSLSESVRNTLQTLNPDDNLSHIPQGKTLYSVFFRVRGDQ